MAFFKLETGHGIRTAAARTAKAGAPKRTTPRALGNLALATAGAPDEADFARF
jgi:methyl-accepting chemotaxis protein